jgi:hypothetical protein
MQTLTTGIWRSAESHPNAGRTGNAFAGCLAMAGVDLKTEQELTGHKTIAMTAGYAHLTPTQKQQAVKSLVRAGSVLVPGGRNMAAKTAQKAGKSNSTC